MEYDHVSGRPTKRFFIFTITKDISLEDCILDLIDNSLDGAKRELGNPEPHLDDELDLSQFRVRLTVREDRFEIADNCGGITLDDAVNYAFTFGATEEDEPEDFSIGLYGIGMKRAVFKMGDRISVRSTFAGDKENEAASFEVPIHVPTWRTKSDWDFDLSAMDALPEPGVSISISELHAATRQQFKNPGFLVGLRRIIARDYSQFMRKGFTIEVNGRAVKPYDFTMLVGGDFQPYRDRFRLNGVDVEIVAGAAAKPQDTSDAEEDGPVEDTSGWYVLCNGRIVLAADKSDTTGWGIDGKARWHPQYRGFLGLILFSSKDAGLLPLTTTKRSVDLENQTYRLALVRMMELARAWIDYTNHRKVDLPTARVTETRAKSASLSELPISKAMVFPRYTTTAPRIQEVTIQYPKPEATVRKLAIALGDPSMSARQVGIASFDYAFDELVGGDG